MAVSKKILLYIMAISSLVFVIYFFNNNPWDNKVPRNAKLVLYDRLSDPLSREDMNDLIFRRVYLDS